MASRSGAAIGATALGAVWCGPGLAPHLPALARAMGVPLRVPRPGGVALTFDDGPHPQGTPAVLDALAARGAKATFFMVAEQVERYRSLADEVVAEGHEAAVHGYHHRNQMRLPPRDFADDLRRATALIAEVYGRPPRLYRPPYGIFTLVGLSIVRRASLDPLLWSRWGRDWRADTDAQKITRLASRGLREDDVVLLHDADWYSSPGSHRHTAAAVPLLLDVLEQRGLRAGPAGEAAW